jgi:hypothetical protein
VRLVAEEQIGAATIASLPWMSDDDRVAAVNEMQGRAGALSDEGQEKWGGGYSNAVESVSVDSFRREIQRGVNG